MMTVSEFIQKLKELYPSPVKFYNATINKSDSKCIGVYARGNATPYKAIGGPQNTSFSTLPISLLVHWTENANDCEVMANLLYQTLFSATNWTIGGRRVISITLLDPGPVNVTRDINNIVEMVIRLNIIYERGAS